MREKSSGMRHRLIFANAEEVTPDLLIAAGAAQDENHEEKGTRKAIESILAETWDSK